MSKIFTEYLTSGIQYHINVSSWDVFHRCYFELYFYDILNRLFMGIQKLCYRWWVMGCWCSYLSGARCRLFAYGPADATASQTPSSLASFKSRLVLPFWYQLNQVVLEKKPLNGCTGIDRSYASMTLQGTDVCRRRNVVGIITHCWGNI